MRITFRTKLLLIVGTALLAFLTFIGGSAWIGAERDRAMRDVEGRLVPKLEVGPRIEAKFGQLRQGMQDAVAAQDREALDELAKTREELLSLISAAGQVLDLAAALEARTAIDAYYESSRAIARRLIAGETGETLVDDMREMQQAQARAATAIVRAATLQQSELNIAFASLRRGNANASRFQLATGLGAALVLFSLSLWFGRALLRTLSEMSSGLTRFATGDFARPIHVTTNDEISDLAREANEMAANLKRLSSERDRHERMRTAQVELAEALRDELDPLPVAERSLKFLAKKTEACAGAFYVKDERGTLRALSTYAHEGELGTAPDVAMGAGLVGQAALADELVEVGNLPKDYARLRSGTGEAAPSKLIFLPLARVDARYGVVELAFFNEPAEDKKELLWSSRGALVAAVDATMSRSRLTALLSQTQEQAAQLAAQEEELRANNEELQSQQTELREVNEELKTQRTALSAQNADLEDARTKLQIKAEELAQVSVYKSQFLAKMSHELRTPLNSMLLLSQLLAENEANTLTPKQVEHAQTIHSAGADLLNLINQILDLAKIESGKQEAFVEEATPDHFARQVRQVFAQVAIQKRIELLTEVAVDAPATITTDTALVERILINLVGNAIKFTEQGRVALTIKRPDPTTRFQREGLARASTLAFEVRDTGIGIAPEALDRIFAPFEQVTYPSTRHRGGTGLGLAIARESAILLGGELQVSSVEGEGTTFTCYLPERILTSRRAPALESAGTTFRTVADDRSTLTKSDRTLLIIEDDPVLAEQLVEMTRGRAFKAVVATSGDEAILLSKQVQPRGIILDVRLPDVDGFAVMTRLKHDPATAGIPVHFISAIDAPNRGLSLGAIGYLVKPATREELVGVVRALTASRNTESSRVLVVEDSLREGESILQVLSHEGVEALHVTTASAALKHLKEDQFGCMILDLGLPDMDGLGLLEAVAASKDMALPRVVVHTGRALTKQEMRHLETYAEAVILKDGNSAERLLEEVRLFLHHVEAKHGTEDSAERPEAASEVDLSGATLLLADDDMRTVYALSALLRARGAEVLVADTGREAVDLLQKNPQVQVVLMDVMMPEMDGYEATRLIRQDERFTTLPLITLTARAMKGERERCIEAGASDYLTKPVDSKKLLSTLAHWLRR